MLVRRHQGRPKTDLIFSQYRYCVLRGHFARALKARGLNEGMPDRRRMVVIHTLRHTFASWLVQMGTPFYTVSKLMGHSSIKMTERYAHLAPDTPKAAVMDLERILAGK